ncbi:hypothetical protein MMC11_000069 [Xylographa trunciseda]|nr:hypothetical protein [Xylographa trunciseda]
MANSIGFQADVSALSLKGVTLVFDVLAFLSADNVAPTAMVQMEQLGSCFINSGRYAAQVPDHLRRCKSVRLDRLSLAVGWWKGDSASIMSNSVDGQAVAMISLYLFSLYNKPFAGDVLYGLSQTFVPLQFAISSVAQLADIGNLLSSKLQILGFGNILAAEVTKIYKVYEQLGEDVPKDFLELLATTTMIELLGFISKALQEEKTILRINGTRGLVYVLAMLVMLFPEDTLVTIKNFVVYEGLRTPIVLSFDCGKAPAEGVLEFYLETSLERSLQDIITIEKSTTGLDFSRDYDEPRPSFKWRVALRIRCNWHSLNAEYRMLLGPSPSDRYMEFQTAFHNLLSAFEMSVPPLQCHCLTMGLDKCSISQGWPDVGTPPFTVTRSCPVKQIWKVVGRSIDTIFWLLFKNPGPKVTWQVGSRFERRSIVLQRTISKGAHLNVRLACEEFFDTVMSLASMQELGALHMRNSYVVAACAKDAHTIFPSSLNGMKLDLNTLGQFQLFDGRILFNNRYHTRVTLSDARSRKRVSNGLPFQKSNLVPTNQGQHSALTLTVRERFDVLELRVSVRVLGEVLDLNPYCVIVGSLGVERTDLCTHLLSKPLDPELEEEVLPTAIKWPIC